MPNFNPEKKNNNITQAAKIIGATVIGLAASKEMNAQGINNGESSDTTYVEAYNDPLLESYQDSTALDEYSNSIKKFKSVVDGKEVLYEKDVAAYNAEYDKIFETLKGFSFPKPIKTEKIPIYNENGPTNKYTEFSYYKKPEKVVVQGEKPEDKIVENPSTLPETEVKGNVEKDIQNQEQKTVSLDYAKRLELYNNSEGIKKLLIEDGGYTEIGTFPNEQSVFDYFGVKNLPILEEDDNVVRYSLVPKEDIVTSAILSEDTVYNENKIIVTTNHKFTKRSPAYSYINKNKDNVKPKSVTVFGMIKYDTPYEFQDNQGRKLSFGFEVYYGIGNFEKPDSVAERKEQFKDALVFRADAPSLGGIIYDKSDKFSQEAHRGPTGGLCLYYDNFNNVHVITKEEFKRRKKLIEEGESQTKILVDLPPGK